MPEMSSTPTLTQGSTLVNIGGFISQVYTWMTAGLLTTAAVAWVVALNPAFTNYILRNDLIGGLFLVELVVVIVLSAMIDRLSMVLAAVLFFVYAALNGVFFGTVVFAIFELSSIYTTFAVTAGTFAVMAFYGMTTKSDLTRIGNLAIMGLFGLIIGTLVNVLLLRSSGVDAVLTYVGIFVFVILIAFDNQKLKNYAAVAGQYGNAGKMAIMGALSLYLDFINLFIRLLAIMGKRK